MATTVTQRITGAITETTTKRIAAPPSATYRCWGSSWGNSWGNSWLGILVFNTIGITARVAGQPTSNITKRVSLG